MEKEFLPYEQALALEELGFDSKKFLSFIFVDDENKFYIPSGWVPDNAIWTPTFSQAFRWFREEYGVECFIKHFKPNDGYPNGYYCISNPNKYYSDSTSDWCFTNFKSYEDAELECLKKLIEIVKK